MKQVELGGENIQSSTDADTLFQKDFDLEFEILNTTDLHNIEDQPDFLDLDLDYNLCSKNSEFLRIPDE